MDIVLTPRENEASYAKCCKPENVVTKNVVRPYWATPTYVCRSTTKFRGTLTKRSSMMLSSIVAFSEGGKIDWHLNREWIRWLMGYEDDYFVI
jgi:hypothetical protein